MQVDRRAARHAGARVCAAHTDAHRGLYLLQVDICRDEWDLPTMTVRVVDSKRRIVLGGVRPGQAFSVTEESDGRIVLTRLEPVRSTPRMSLDECRDAIEAAPLQPAVSWDELREATREPSSCSTPTC